MAISNLEIATRVRNLVTERSPAAVDVTLPHITALIPTALETWSRAAAKDPAKYQVLTDDFTVPLVAGVLDLTTYIDGTNAKIDLDDLRANTVYTTINGVRTPFTWVSSQSQLNYGRFLGSSNPALFLEGNTLRTRNTDGSQTSLGTANISFTVLNYPATAAQLPPSLLGDFILYLSDLVLKEKYINAG